MDIAKQLLQRIYEIKTLTDMRIGQIIKNVEGENKISDMSDDELLEAINETYSYVGNIYIINLNENGEHNYAAGVSWEVQGNNWEDVSNHWS